MRVNHAVAVLVAASSLAFASSAHAGVGVDLGVGVDADVDVRVGEPYTYDGYRSGRWYAYDEPRRRGRYNKRYRGYDCYKAFYYTWEGRHRARYKSTWCYDERGRDYEVRGTRVVVRLD